LIPGGRSRIRYDKNGKYIKYRNKLVKGIGICDLPTSDEFGNRLKSNVVWMSLFSRAPTTTGYLDAVKNPTYVDVSIDPRWHKYSGFVPWFDEHYREGFALDKDLRVSGNKVYGPDTCAFVPQYINNLTLDRARYRGEFPVGVTYNKRQNSFAAQLNVFKQHVGLGYFDNPEDASYVYLLAKSRHIRFVAETAFDLDHIDEEVYAGLVRYADGLKPKRRKLVRSHHNSRPRSSHADFFAYLFND
jgi:hypothetical protein